MSSNANNPDESKDNNNNKKKETVSSLMDLFANPPPTTDDKNSTASTTATATATTERKGPTAPGGPTTTRAATVAAPALRPTTTTNTSSSTAATPAPASASVDDGSMALTPHNTRNLTHLQGLFAPPPPNIIPPTNHQQHHHQQQQQHQQHVSKSTSSNVGVSTTRSKTNAATSLNDLFAPPPISSTSTIISSHPPPTTTTTNETTSLLWSSGDGGGGSAHDTVAAADHVGYEYTININEKERRNNNINSDYDDYFVGEEPTISQSPTELQPSSSKSQSHLSWYQKVQTHIQEFCQEQLKPTTFAGSFMFLLYHVVFCLAMASSITRPHHLDKPILGIMADYSASGIFFAGPFYIWRLGSDIPALYPSIDLFLAPFLAEAAAIIDDTLVNEIQQDYPDTIFWSTFAVLVGIGMALAGLLLILASSWKLANLGTYLPYSVLCGFFSAVGVLLWALAFSVDTSGKTWKMVFLSENTSREEMIDALIHHIPSLCIGILMNRLGPKNPFFVILLIIVTLLIFYFVMWITGTSLEEAQEAKWFWGLHELTTTTTTATHTGSNIGNNNNSTDSTQNWQDFVLPPMPFSNVGCLISSYTHWGAVWAGLGNMFALAFLYLLRSSIHASAMKKNVNNLVRRIPIPNNPSSPSKENKNENRDRNSSTDYDNHVDDGDDDNSLLSPMISPSSHAGDGASGVGGYHNYAAIQAVESVRETVRIVNMSLADPPAGQQQEEQQQETATTSMESPTATTISTDVNNNNSNKNHSANAKKKTLRVSVPVPRLDSKGNPIEGQATEEVEEIRYEEIRAKPSKKSLEAIFQEYGYALLIIATTGGFGNCPTVATSNTMYAIGAEAAAPQYGSVLLLIIFYVSDFSLVRFIPKAAFSSLLVLGAVDTLVVWFFGAFKKTLDWSEWLVVPFIVAFSLVVGFLNAVFLGIGISMFVFVGNFFRVGVVKFNATCLELRSRIERSIQQSEWLDENGDLAHVLVLQNYLFFGNATTVLRYIETMFDEDVGLVSSSGHIDYSQLPPFPKVLILDFGLTTGMDTSTADIFSEIKELCKNNGCKLFLCSLSSRMKKGLALSGIKPEHGARSDRLVRFFADLDTALGKAEDYLLEIEGVTSNGNDDQMIGFATNSPTFLNGIEEDGFLYALRQIDELHGQDFASTLEELAPFVRPIELLRGRCLFQSDGGIIKESERGLFFIESGLLKVERDSKQTMTMTRTRSYQSLGTSSSRYTLRNEHARIGSVARKRTAEKSERGGGMSNTMRVARLGPGWVAGIYENASGFRTGGVMMAMSPSVKLHHLSFQRLEELETTHPALILKLYKMLSFLMARKDEITTSHLSTLHTIMTSPPQSKPISRSTLKAFAGM